MTTELAFLAWSAALTSVLWIPYILSRFMVWGITDTVGYPDNPPALPKWAQRAQKAHLNMIENFPAFAALVLIAHITQQSSAATVTGAALFFYARLVHAIVHILGIPWIRTLAFIVGWVGIVVLFFAVL